MTVPYYQDDLVTLYLGDALTLTDHWTGPDIDVLITDPPYGRDWKPGNIHGKSYSAPIAGDKDTTTRDTALTAWGTNRPAILFGDLLITPPAGAVQTLIYLKPSNAGLYGARGGFRRDVEAIYLVGHWTSGFAGRTSIVATRATHQGNPSSLQSRMRHSHAKPGDVMSLLVEATQGVVADPFAGSGSTLVAAKALGRRSIGVEIDEKYCETAARRLSQGVLDFGEPLLQEVM